MGGRTAVAGVIAVWLGMACGAAAGPYASLALAFALGLAWIAWRAPPRVATVAVVLVLGLSGAARAGAFKAALEAEQAQVPSRPGLYRVVGTIVEPPRLASGEPQVIVAVTVAQPPLHAGTRLRLRLPSGTTVHWSDRLTALVRLERPRARRNPGGYDARAAAAARGVVGRGRAFWADPEPAPLWQRWPRVTLSRWRQGIEARLRVRLEDRARTLVLPLMVGDRSGLPPEWNARLRAAGLVHLLALSGLHVTWLAAVVRGAVAALGGGVRARALAGAACALFYLGLSGPLPSLARAASTEVLEAGARIGSRALDSLQALSMSALGLLVLAPGWAFDLGFQLSCGATLGLVSASRAASQSERLTTLKRVLGPGLGAQLAAMPLLIARVHAMSWVTPLSNLAAVPVVGLLLSSAWLAVALDLALPGFGRPFFAACEALTLGFGWIAAWAARAPGVLIAAGHEPGIVWVGAAGAALLVVSIAGPRTLIEARRPSPVWRIGARLLGVLSCAIAVLLAATPRPLQPPAGRLWVVVLDVGQGDAIAVASGRRWWLVDAGPRTPRHDAGERTVVPFLRWAGVGRLAGLFVTHGDGDHAGGVEAVRRALAVRRLMTAPGAGALPDARSLVRGAQPFADPAIRVLWPPRHWPRDLEPSDNAASLVLEVGSPEASAVLLADVDSTVEARLEPSGRVVLTKVAHHGSGSSSGRAWLARIEGIDAAISCGRSNPFGHPHTGVLARLREAGVRVHRTDRAGALWFELSAGSAGSIDWREGRLRVAHRADRAAGLPHAPACR